MSKKMMFIMIPVVGLTTFIGTLVGVLTSTPEPVPVADSNLSPEALEEQQLELGLAEGGAVAVKSRERMMNEDQLRDLIRDVRDRVKEYETRLRGLDLREARIETTQTALQEDVDKLNELRVEVASAVAELKSQRDALEKTRIKIDRAEVESLKATADTLGLMPADSAGRLLVTISQSIPEESLEDAPDHVMEDVGEGYAVKLLHYMEKKKRGKLLSAMIDLDPALAGSLMRKLKNVIEMK